MDNINLIIAAVLGTGGLGGFLALFVVPASKKWEGAEARLLRVETKVAELESDVKFLTSGITALSFHSDGLRTIVLRHEPSLEIQTANEILAHVRDNIDNLTRE